MNTSIGKTGRNEQTRRVKRLRVYVVLLNWNGWQDTIMCLESLLNESENNRWMKEHFLRIVVCDNGSSDDSRERIAAWAAGLLHPAPAPHHELNRLLARPIPKPAPLLVLPRNEAERIITDDSAFPPPGKLPGDIRIVLIENGDNRGFAAGNNPGVQLALADGADYVWLLNNDTLTPPGTLEKLADYMETHPRVGAAGSMIYFADEPHRLQTFGGGYLTRFFGRDRFARSADEVRYICGTSMFLRREALTRAGLLDEGFFFYWEDADLSRRIIQKGWELGVAENTIVYHKFSATVGGGSLNSDIFRAAALIRYFRKHWKCWPFPVAVHIAGMTINRLLRGQFRRIPAILKQLRVCFAPLFPGSQNDNFKK